jgi:nucleoside-diphosphate-sugar epimerase
VATTQILITGAAGFVGRHLARALAAAYPDATLLTHALDVRDAAAVSGVIRTVVPDSCIHLAAISTIAAAQADEDQAWQVNLHGTLNLARAILRHAPKCQLIYASTADIYGASFGSRTALDENALLAPMNPYSATKAAADIALGSMAATRGFRVVRLRPVNHTGPGQTSQYVVAEFARQVACIAAGSQPSILRVGNLDPERDFLDVRDVCAAFVACVARRDDLRPGEIINLASGEARRIGDILNDLQALAGIAAEVQVENARRRATDVPIARVDATHARNALGWTPTIPWKRTLQDVLDDWRERLDCTSQRD